MPGNDRPIGNTDLHGSTLIAAGGDSDASRGLRAGRCFIAGVSTYVWQRAPASAVSVDGTALDRALVDSGGLNPVFPAAVQLDASHESHRDRPR